MRIAHDERSEVVLLHVLPPRGYASDAHHVDLEPERTPAAARGAGRAGRSDHPGADRRAAAATPRDQIPTAAREHGAHLLVMGAERNARGWPGRVADRVARAGLPAVLFVWPESESDEEFDER